jgi:hypothetical protein
MKLLHRVDVKAVKVGDTLIIGAHRYEVTSIAEEVTSIKDGSFGRDFTLKSTDGFRKCHTVAYGKKITIEA